MTSAESLIQWYLYGGSSDGDAIIIPRLVVVFVFSVIL